MSSNVMGTLAEVEERLRKQRADAAAAAKQAAASAREQGEQEVADAVKRAGREVSELISAAEARARKAADTLANGSAAERERLRDKAKKREEEAVSFVVERIVNG